MKILDIPQSGKRGLNVSQGGRYSRISRALVIPANPRTQDQLNRHQILGTKAHNRRTLTEEQRLAWIEAAKLIQSRSRLGQSGPMTGEPTGLTAI
jgi:hypothetical protein